MSTLNSIALYRRHVAALFDQPSEAEWLVEAQRRASAQIEDAGMADKLRFTLRGLEDAAARVLEPLEVFIVGEGKHGKSTLVNALMGRYLAEVDFAPRTWCFSRFVASDKHLDTMLFFVEGNLDDYPHLAEQLCEPFGKSRGLLVHSIPTEEGTKLFHAEDKRVQDKANGYRSPVMEVEWHVPADKAAMPGLRLVDTQGLLQNLNTDGAHRHYVSWQYERADAVLWVLSASQLDSADTVKELDRLARYSKPIILLINKWDEEREPDRRLKAALKRYAGRAAAVVPFSALQAFLSACPAGYEYTPQDIKRRQRWGAERWEDLQDRSGLPKLLDTFDKIVEQKHRLVRRRQVYLALRRKQCEFRYVLACEQRQAKRNLKKYKDIKAEIEKASNELTNNAMHRIIGCGREAKGEIRKALPYVTPQNRGEWNSLLKVHEHGSQLHDKVRSQCKEATGRLAGIVRETSKNSQYADAEYGPDGTAAFTYYFNTMADVAVNIAPPDGNLNAEADKTLEWLAWLASKWWLAWLIIIFTGKSEAQLLAEMRQQIVEGLEKQINEVVDKSVSSLQMEIKSQCDRMLSSLEYAVQRLGGQKALEDSANRIEHSLQTVAIPCVFVSAAVRAMSKLGWPKAS